MSEWKKYDETTFTDFGSVGETVPVQPDGGMDYGATVPEGGVPGGLGDTPIIKTIPDYDPSDKTEEGEGLESWNASTVFGNAPIVNAMGESIRPATGWLVCIEGATKGKDYRIYEGYTYVGRDPAQNQVAIEDDHVSSVPSVRILYENQERKFYINETNGAKNPVYLNDKLFDGRVELHAYDIIKMGNTRLLFVPLCTDKFAWEEIK